MQSRNTKSALHGSTNECTRTNMLSYLRSAVSLQESLGLNGLKPPKTLAECECQTCIQCINIAVYRVQFMKNSACCVQCMKNAVCCVQCMKNVVCCVQCMKNSVCCVQCMKNAVCSRHCAFGSVQEFPCDSAAPGLTGSQEPGPRAVCS